MTENNKSPIRKYSNLVIYGSISFMLLGLLNIADQLIWFLSARNQIVGYIFISLVSLSLLPIGWGFFSMLAQFYSI